jgi:hypothetical protein
MKYIFDSWKLAMSLLLFSFMRNIIFKVFRFEDLFILEGFHLFDIVFMNSANFIVSFNGKRMDFTGGICETDEKERKIVCSLYM